MKTKIEVELKPFNVPSYALDVQQEGQRQDGFTEGKKYHLSELNKDTLETMCDDFRSSIMEKSGYEKTNSK